MLEREAFLDKLRVAATCAVVLLHTVTGVMDHADMGSYPLENTVFLTVMDLVCWCVPVFLMISGYLFLRPEREISFRRMLTHYCRRIALALLLFGVPYACLEQIAEQRAFRPAMLAESVVMVLKGQSWSHMWYLYLILLLYLLTPAVKWLLARTPRPAIYVLLGAMAVGNSIAPWLSRLITGRPFDLLPDFTIYFFYYLCGYLFATHRFRRRLPVLAPAALALGMAASRFPGGCTLQMAYNYPFTAVLAILIFARAVSCGKCPGEQGAEGGAFIRSAAALTFAVYLIHPIFLNVCYKFLHVTPLDFFIGVSLPLFFLGTLALSFAFAWILCRIPPLKKYVL